MLPGRRACIAAGLAVALELTGLPTPVRAGPADSLTFRTLPAETPRVAPASSWSRRRVPLLVGGAALTVASLLSSQLLLAAANRRYEQYRQSPDPAQMERHYSDARRLDHWSDALLIVGESAAAATLLLAWRVPEHGLAVSVQPVPGGAGLRVAWNP
ncbi:MAG: hypothetical protein HZB25_05190 [Candidatus Eisenbacteria bacterium]|nr:hypothetical protein [Candidatus Eisenbacteria bacterium]